MNHFLFLYPQKLVFLLTICVLFIFIIFLFPPFIFNELEHHFRKELSNGLVKDAIAAERIEQRKYWNQTGENFNEAILAGEEVEKYLGEAVAHFERAERHAQRQQPLLFVTSAKYREYSRIQRMAVAKMIENERFFLDMKARQHRVTDMIAGYTTFRQFVFDMNDQEMWWQTMEAVEPYSQQLRAEITSMKDNGDISTELYEFLSREIEVFAFMREQAIKVDTSEDWNDLDWDGLAQLAKPEDPSLLLADITNQWLANEETYQQQYEEIDQQLYLMNEYYRQHKLSEDLLTRVLAQFFTYYPRVNFNNSSDPTVVPYETSVEELSLR